MAIETLEIRVKSPRQIRELMRAADREHLSTERYVKQVIAEHLERIKRIEKSSFFELAAPLREALKGKTEEELDALVKEARARRKSRHRRHSS